MGFDQHQPTTIHDGTSAFDWPPVTISTLHGSVSFNLPPRGYIVGEESLSAALMYPATSAQPL